ncbi:MAG TPA: insulinase family protein [Myxococcus sp.]|nr:insulinase family protein [Myxococcus sp.]
MSRFPALLLLCCLYASGCATLTGAPDDPWARSVRLRGTYDVFPSGLRLVTYEDPAATRMTMAVSYGVGSADEPAGKEGLAHLVEHLTYAARPLGRDGTSLQEQLLATGAWYNGGTSADDTSYWFRVPSEDFGTLAELEGWRLREPLAHLTEEDFVSARNVVLAELRQRQESMPEGAQLSQLHAALLPGHPYGHAIGGTAESLQRLTLKDARDFVERHYMAANAVVVASGPLLSSEVRYRIARAFTGLTGSGRAGRSPPLARTPPPMPDELPPDAPMAVRRTAVSQPTLWLMWPLPGLYSGQAAHAEATTLLLRSSNLGAVLVNDTRIEDWGLHTQLLDGMAMLLVRVRLKKEEDAPAVAKWVREQVLQQAHHMTVNKPSASNRGALLARLRYTQVLTSLEQLPLSEVARHLRATGKANYLTARQQPLPFEELRAMAAYHHEYLRPERARALLVVPEPGAAEEKKEPEREALHWGLEDYAHWKLPVPEGTLDVRRVARGPGLDAAERYTLANGMKVVALRRGSIPLVEALLIIRTRQAGAGDSPLELPNLAMSSSFHSARKPRWHAAWVGTRTGMRVDGDHTILQMTAASGNLEHVVDDVRQWLVDGKPSPRVFAAVQGNQVRQLEHEVLRADGVANRALDSRLFPGHPYGGFPKVEGVRAITWPQVEEWVARELQPERATLVLVGDLPEAEALKAMVETQLGGWGGKAGPLEPVAAPPPLPARRAVALVDQPGARLAGIRVGLRGPALDAASDAAGSALAWLLERRLAEQLRERLGVTYGVWVARSPLAVASTFKVGTAVARDVAASALEQVLAELRALNAEALPEPLVSRARWQLARDYDLRFDTIGDVSGRLAGLERFERSPGYWETTFPEAIAGLTPKSLQEAMAKLAPETAVVVITGDAATLKPQLEGAGFEVELLSP